MLDFDDLATRIMGALTDEGARWSLVSDAGYVTVRRRKPIKICSARDLTDVAAFDVWEFDALGAADAFMRHECLKNALTECEPYILGAIDATGLFVRLKQLSTPDDGDWDD